METKTHWFADIAEDPDSGELVMIFPSGLIQAMGWTEGTVLKWNVADDGTISLKQSHEEET